MNGAAEIEMQRWARGLRLAKVVWLTVPCLLALGGVLWLRGASFYVLPLAARVDHADYAWLSPSRPAGRAYGVVALLLIALNLGYLLRRRFPHWPLGRMRLWLDLHVFTGMTAALFVAFHAAFQLRSPVARATAATLALTVLSGIVGRFFHLLAPSEARALAPRIAALEALAPGITAPLCAALDASLPRAEPPVRGLVRVLGRLPGWWRCARTRRARVRATIEAHLAALPAPERAWARPLARELSVLAGREVHALAGSALRRAWRPWHRTCALLMVGGILLHVAVALFYGYGGAR